MSRFKTIGGALLLAVLIVAAGCQDNKSTSPVVPSTFVITGSVGDSIQLLVGATVTAWADSGWSSDATDSSGDYALEFSSRPDTVRICVTAVNYVVQCSTFTPTSDTLQADWELTPTVATDSIFLSVDTVAPGDTAEILVNIGNPDSAIAAMTVWLKPEISTITFDTTAPVSPRFPVSGMEWQSVDHSDENIAVLFVIDFQAQEFIPKGSGPLMKVFYAVDPSTPPGTYAINSEAIPGVLRPFELSYRSGLSMPHVLFIPGAIVVQ